MRGVRTRPQRGYFAVGIVGGKTPENLGVLWRTASLYHAAFVFTVNCRYTGFRGGDTPKTSNHTPLFHFADMADLKAHVPRDCALLGVEMHDDAVPLRGFTHPERAAYLLGAEDRGLTPDQVEGCDGLIQLECAAAESMNVAVAGSIVLYERFVSRMPP